MARGTGGLRARRERKGDFARPTQAPASRRREMRAPPGHGVIDDARGADHRARSVEAPFRGGRPAAAWPTTTKPASGSGKVRSAAGDAREEGAQGDCTHRPGYGSSMMLETRIDGDGPGRGSAVPRQQRR